MEIRHSWSSLVACTKIGTFDTIFFPEKLKMFVSFFRFNFLGSCSKCSFSNGIEELSLYVLFRFLFIGNVVLLYVLELTIYYFGVFVLSPHSVYRDLSVREVLTSFLPVSLLLTMWEVGVNIAN